MVICIDFDGTCVSHEFPLVGNDIGAIPVLKKIVNSGNQIVLFTMRGNLEYNIVTQRTVLDDAIYWFEINGIPLYGINNNPSQKEWTDSPKAYGNLYIDDAALGCPLKFDKEISDRPFVDWIEVERILKKNRVVY